jgi:hypothetical protein
LAGQTATTFSLTAPNDAQVNLQRSVTINASGLGVTSATGNIVVNDDEAAPIPTLTLPASLY